MLCWFARILFAVKSWWRNGALLTSVGFSLELEMIVTDKSRVCQSAFVWMEVRKWLSIEIWIYCTLYAAPVSLQDVSSATLKMCSYERLSPKDNKENR